MKCSRCKATKEQLRFTFNLENVGEEDEGFVEVNVACFKCDEIVAFYRIEDNTFIATEE